MSSEKHIEEFLSAARGNKGDLDAWLERNNERECRFAILGALAAERERVANWLSTQRNDVPATGREFAEAVRAL